MKTKLLAGIIIFGLILSSSSIYLKVAFADDNWSDIAKRQQVAEQRAEKTYQNKYQFTNMDETKRNWSGLSSTETNSTTRGRNIDSQAAVSLENALAQFDKIHILQLADLQAKGYQNLTSIPTDTQGRDRNAMIAQARSESMSQADQSTSDRSQIQATYTDLAPGETTDTITSNDRQAGIEKTQSNQEYVAAGFVSPLATLDTSYVNLHQYKEGTSYAYQAGSVTNTKTSYTSIAEEEKQSMEKAIFIFNQIHSKQLSQLQTPTYGGVMGSYSGSWYQNYDPQQTVVGDNSIQKAQDVISSYYQSQGLK